MNDTKKFYESKTLWLNAIGFLGMMFAPEGTFGHVLAPEEVGAGLAGLNILLRLFTSKGVVS